MITIDFSKFSTMQQVRLSDLLSGALNEFDRQITDTDSWAVMPEDCEAKKMLRELLANSEAVRGQIREWRQKLHVKIKGGP